MAIRKIRITKVLKWVMIPLIVLGSMPRMGCVCADGQHKMFCQRHLQGNRTGGCVCCQGMKAAGDGCHSATPVDKPACCQTAGRKCASGCPSLTEGRPCRPVVDRSDIVTAAKAALDLDRVEAAPMFAAVELLPAVIAPVATDFFRGESLPPPDLITTLGVLLI